jgi:hypothetical protein
VSSICVLHSSADWKGYELPKNLVRNPAGENLKLLFLACYSVRKDFALPTMSRKTRTAIILLLTNVQLLYHSMSSMTDTLWSVMHCTTARAVFIFVVTHKLSGRTNCNLFSCKGWNFIWFSSGSIKLGIEKEYNRNWFAAKKKWWWAAWLKVILKWFGRLVLIAVLSHSRGLLHLLDLNSSEALH